MDCSLFEPNRVIEQPMSNLIETEIVAGVATLTLNRPEKRNALTREFIGEMNEWVTSVSLDDTVRLFLIQSKGDVFCAGMDLGEMQSRIGAVDPESEWQKDSDVYNDLVSKIFQLEIPTLAVLPGPVLAGGTGMVFACDIVLASNNVFFQLPEPRRGITAAMVCPLLLYRTNVSTASYLLLSGKRVEADDALRMGLVNELVPKDQLMTRRNELVASILTGSQSALGITKKHLRKMANVDVSDQIRASASVSAEARKTDDAKEGLAAFLEKRKPGWDASIS